MVCCGREVKTEYCGRCGQKNGAANPLYGLLQHCVEKARLATMEAQMWRAWADALTSLADPAAGVVADPFTAERALVAATVANLGRGGR